VVRGGHDESEATVPTLGSFAHVDRGELVGEGIDQGGVEHQHRARVSVSSVAMAGPLAAGRG